MNIINTNYYLNVSAYNRSVFSRLSELDVKTREQF